MRRKSGFNGNNYKLDEHCRNKIKLLYWNENRSQREIAKIFGVSQSAIAYFMKRYKIETKSRQDLMRGKKNPFFGRKHSEQTKKVIGIKNRKPRSKEVLISTEQSEILTGLLLSDGHISTSNYAGRYSQGCKYKEFLEHVKRVLPFQWSPLWEDKKWNCFHLKSRYSPTLLSLGKKWYPKGKKIVPRDLKITRKVLLYWFLGDGYIRFPTKSRNPNTKHFQIQLCTDSFTREDNLRLVEELSKLELSAVVTTKNRLRFSAKSNQRFFKLVGSSPVHCYNYKWRCSV